MAGVRQPNPVTRVRRAPRIARCRSGTLSISARRPIEGRSRRSHAGLRIRRPRCNHSSGGSDNRGPGAPSSRRRLDRQGRKGRGLRIAAEQRRRAKPQRATGPLNGTAGMSFSSNRASSPRSSWKRNLFRSALTLRLCSRRSRTLEGTSFCWISRRPLYTSGSTPCWTAVCSTKIQSMSFESCARDPAGGFVSDSRLDAAQQKVYFCVARKTSAPGRRRRNAPGSRRHLRRSLRGTCRKWPRSPRVWRTDLVSRRTAAR